MTAHFLNSSTKSSVLSIKKKQWKREYFVQVIVVTCKKTWYYKMYFLNIR